MIKIPSQKIQPQVSKHKIQIKHNDSVCLHVQNNITSSHQIINQKHHPTESWGLSDVASSLTSRLITTTSSFTYKTKEKVVIDKT